MRDPIVAEAAAFFERCRSLPTPVAIQISVLWAGHLRTSVLPIIQRSERSEDIIAAATGENLTTYPVKTSDPLFQPMIDTLLWWLDKRGGLKGQSALIQETPFTPANVVSTITSRRRFCITSAWRSALKKPSTLYSGS
jgi:hypothetical protein